MEPLKQEYILSVLFLRAIDREELLAGKSRHYSKTLVENSSGRVGRIRRKGGKETESAVLLKFLSEFEETAHKHIAMLKDKMIKLNIQG